MPMAPDTAGGRFLVLCLLLFAHALGDCLFQPRSLTRLKRRSGSALLAHGLVVAGAVLAVIAPFSIRDAVRAALLVGGAHLLIDRVKIGYEKRNIHPGRTRNGALVNIFDQVLHLGVILLVWRFFVFDLTFPGGPPAGAGWVFAVLAAAAVMMAVRVFIFFAHGEALNNGESRR